MQDKKTIYKKSASYLKHFFYALIAAILYKNNLRIRLSFPIISANFIIMNIINIYLP